MMLSVNGNPVMECAEAHQKLMDMAAGADAREGIRQGLEDVRKGRTRPAEEFFHEFEARHGLSQKSDLK